MSWMNQVMEWGWMGMLLAWIASVFLIGALISLLADWMDREPPNSDEVPKTRSAPSGWFADLRSQFDNWRRANAEAHAKSRPGNCCAAPPPGAGHWPSHGNGLH